MCGEGTAIRATCKTGDFDIKAGKNLLELMTAVASFLRLVIIEHVQKSYADIKQYKNSDT